MRFTFFDPPKSTDADAIETQEENPVDQLAGDPAEAAPGAAANPSPPKYRLIPTTTFGSFEGPR